MEMKFLVVIERGKRNFSAYSPDLPGCIATGKTLNATRNRMREAIAFHIEGLRRRGTRVPRPTATAEVVELA